MRYALYTGARGRGTRLWGWYVAWDDTAQDRRLGWAVVEAKTALFQAQGYEVLPYAWGMLE